MKFCCSNMATNCEVWSRNSIAIGNDKTLIYDPVERLFGYFIQKGTRLENSSVQTIVFCPFCGIKLPSQLYDEYIMELEKTLGRTNYEALFYEDPISGWCLDRTKTPKEFQSDEWWIKRGL